LDSFGLGSKPVAGSQHFMKTEATFAFRKVLGISFVAGQLLISQEGISSMDLVN
jgi:hypothetical protein